MLRPKHFKYLTLGGLTLGTSLAILNYTTLPPSFSETEIGIEPAEKKQIDLGNYKNWTRPEGHIKVGIQAGHLKTEEAPYELRHLRYNTGASSNGILEREVNLKIAELTKKLLEEKGIVVDLLPTTIPQDYWADVFISIHADGNKSKYADGFQVGIPEKDLTQKSQYLKNFLEKEYQKETNLNLHKRITKNLKHYYAFNWSWGKHSIHPMTPAALIETGFITSPKDTPIIVETPEKAAQGIANGILKFLELIEE